MVSTGRGLERAVAQLFRYLGCKVEHNKRLGGSQVDVYVVDRMRTGLEVRIAVDTKDDAGSTGVDRIREVDRHLAGIRRDGLVHIVLIVASHGFTREARDEAHRAHLDLLELDDLETSVAQVVGALEGPRPHDPFGALDAVHALPEAGRVRIRGWAIDPDTKGAISVRLSVDGAAMGVYLANELRPDVAQHHRDYGPNHGYSIDVPLTVGYHVIAVDAVNVGIGRDKPLGIQSIEL